MLTHKGYYGRVEFDDESGIFHGEVLGIRDVVTFEGTSVQSLRKAFRDSVDDYLAFCQKRGEAPDKPCSGKFVVRVSPELHRDAATVAAANRMSLNRWVTDQIQRAVEERGVK
jgi:predicted HicB family RNase H-like nuclease